MCSSMVRAFADCISVRTISKNVDCKVLVGIRHAPGLCERALRLLQFRCRFVCLTSLLVGQASTVLQPSTAKSSFYAGRDTWRSSDEPIPFVVRRKYLRIFWRSPSLFFEPFCCISILSHNLSRSVNVLLLCSIRIGNSSISPLSKSGQRYRRDPLARCFIAATQPDPCHTWVGK